MRFAFRFARLVVLGSAMHAFAGGALARDEDLFIGAADLHTVLFGTVDAGRSTFVSAGAKTTPVTSLDRTGPVLMETNGYGVNPERFRGDDVSLPALRITSKAALLTCWQWAMNGVYVAALAGPEIVHEQLTIDGSFVRLSQVRPGLQLQGELWAEPLPQIVVAGTVVAGSAQGSIYARAATGYKVTPDVMIGPEVTTYTTHTYQEVRWGGQITGIPLYMLRMRLSGGMMFTDDKRPSTPYVSAAIWLRM